VKALFLSGFVLVSALSTAQPTPKWRGQVNRWVEQERWTEALELLLVRSARAPSEDERRLRIRLYNQLSKPHLERSEWLQLASEQKLTQTDRNRLATLSIALGSVESAARALLKSPTSNPDLPERALFVLFYTQMGSPVPPRFSMGTDELLRIPGAWIRHRTQMSLALDSVARGDTRQALRFLSTDVGRSSEFDEFFRHLQRARLLYGQQRFEDALEVASQIPRSSASWFAATQVAAWSASRMGDDNLALGQLMSLHSPYLAAKYSAESWLLQASALYRLCYLNSASKSLEELERRYGNLAVVISKFNRELGTRFTGVTSVLNFARGNRNPPVGYDRESWNLLMDALLQSEVLQQTEAFLLASSAGLSQLKKMESLLSRDRFSKSLWRRYQEDVQQSRREQIRVGFRGLTNRLAALRNELASVLEASLAVDLEVNTRLRDRLVTSEVPKVQELDVDAEIAQGFDFWPFEGEFWRDEVGSYYLALPSACGATER